MDMFPFPVVSVILAANDTVLATPNIPKTTVAHIPSPRGPLHRSLITQRGAIYKHVESLFKCSTGLMDFINNSTQLPLPPFVQNVTIPSVVWRRVVDNPRMAFDNGGLDLMIHIA